MSKSVSRRDFIKGSLASAAALGLVGTGMPVFAEDGVAPEKATEGFQYEDAEFTGKVWGEAPLPVESFDFAEVTDCDLVVVGAGCSGMPAAVSAAQSGLKVVVLEKMPSGFGVRDYMGAVDSTAQKNAGVNIDKKQIVNELLRYSSNRADARLVKLWAEKSGEALDWFEGIQKDAGMEMWLETDINSDNEYKEYSTCHMFYHPEDANITSTTVMADRMVAEGCDVRYMTPMVQLIQQDGRVTGVVAKNPDGTFARINASKGVMLATGGYASNKEMMLALNEKDYKGNVMQYSWPGCTGDGIRAAHHAGGEMDITHTAMYFERGCTLPGGVGGDFANGTLWWMGSQPFLQVNKKGERFANESVPYDYDLHAAANQPGHVFVQVFDKNWQQDVLAFHTIGCSRIVAPEQAPEYPTCGWNTIAIEMATVLPGLESGHVQTADTIEELAEKMGMDPSVLAATVERYNRLCDLGEDLDFGKEAYRMRPVVEAPFYAVTCGGQLLCTMDGMLIDTDFRVLDANGDPVPGLYAGGNDSGCFFADCYPELAVGVAAGRSMTFGYLLGKKLAE